MERLTAIVEGQVQGVGYRYWASQRARLLRLDGWVRNRADGSVETLAEGPRAALTEFLGLLREGPLHADVLSVTPTFGPGTGEFAGFRIR